MTEKLLNDISSAVNLLSSRRSATVKALGDPGPTREQLQEIMNLAVRVPDHGKLAPWRFILFESEARQMFGERLATRWKELHPETSAESLHFWRTFFLRAPTVLALVSRAKPHPKIPEWEQVLSAGAVGMSLLLAATSLGIGVQWNTDWPAYDESIWRLMNLEPFERIAGFFYFGTSTQVLEDRPRPDVDSLTTWWQG